jgi:hypothetical protein
MTDPTHGDDLRRRGLLPLPDPHAVELVIRIVGERPWNRNTKTKLVEPILRSKAADAIETAEFFAREWTRHGEPCTAEVVFREVRVADGQVRP